MRQIRETTWRHCAHCRALAVIARPRVRYEKMMDIFRRRLPSSSPSPRRLYGDGDRNLNLGSATFTVCRCNLSPGYSPILPFVIPRNVDEPPKTPPKEILRRLTVAGKRSLHHVTTFISSFQKMRAARLKCTEDHGLVLLSRNEGERANRAWVAKDAGDREIGRVASYVQASEMFRDFHKIISHKCLT